MKNQEVYCFRFDDIRVEPENFRASKGDALLELEPKTFLLLTYLIEHRDRLVDKRELLEAIWKDVAVTENSLTREIGKLRKSLGDDPKVPKYIETVHTRGYRFIADVQAGGEASAASAKLGSRETSPDPLAADRRISKWVPYKVFVALSAAGLLAFSAFLLRNPAEATKAPRSRASLTTLAVLPFRPLSADPNDRYEGIAIADALITKLANSARLSIEPLSTVLHYADPEKDSLAIGRAMQVDYVLEGKFQKLGDRLRATVQLLCVACEGKSRWAATFDETSQDLFQVQDSISQKVAATLPLDLSGDEQKRLAKRETSNSDAQLAFAKGKFFQAEDTQESLDKSIEYFQLAATRDPNYAAPWALMADSYRRRELYGVAPADFLPLVREAAAHARSLDDSIPYAHSMLGLIAFQFDWDFATAAREYARALAIQPSWMHQWYFRYLLATNHSSEAEAGYVRFSQMVPFSAFGNTNFAEFLFLTRQYARAAEQARKTIAMRPDYAAAHELLGQVYEQQGLADQAAEEFQKAIDLSNGYEGLASLGHLYAVSGKRAELGRVLDDLQAQRKRRYVAPFEFALVRAGMGDNRTALSDLQQAYSERSLSAQSLRFDPRLDSLRRDPDYRQFAKRLGLN